MVSIYHSPNTPIKSFHDEYKHQIEKLNSEKNCDIILGLNHNLDFLNSNSHKDIQLFIELNVDNNLLPCITRLTRITKSTATLIDNTLISKNLQGRQDSRLLISDICDHLPSLTSLAGPFVEKRQLPYVKSRQINTQKVKSISSVLDSHNWSSELKSLNVNNGFDYWHETLTMAIDQYAPEKLIKLPKGNTKETLG